MLLKEKTWFESCRETAKQEIANARFRDQEIRQETLRWAKGDFETWFSSHYSSLLTRAEATKLMNLAKAFPTSTPALEPNLIRAGLLILGIYPQKTHTPIPGDAKIRHKPTHLSVVNRFGSWHGGLKAKPTAEQAARFRADFEPITKFLASLPGMPPR